MSWVSPIQSEFEILREMMESASLATSTPTTPGVGDFTLDEVTAQRHYYARTASLYDGMRTGDTEHAFALSWLEANLEHFGFHSLLDVGAGTGRVLGHLQARFPELRCVGVEPVEALRKQGYARGVSPTQLIDGDAYNLQFNDSSFDVVTEFGVLHHLRWPSRAIDEMLRVSKRGIFISDCNNWGQGTRRARIVKQCLRQAGLWAVFNYVRTHGRGYHVSHGDGVAYSYSAFDSMGQIQRHCPTIHLLNTLPLRSGPNLLLSTTHVALFGLKSEA